MYVGAVGEPGERVRRRDADGLDLLLPGGRRADLDLVAGDGGAVHLRGCQVSATWPSPAVVASPVTWSGTALGFAGGGAAALARRRRCWSR